MARALTQIVKRFSSRAFHKYRIYTALKDNHVADAAAWPELSRQCTANRLEHLPTGLDRFSGLSDQPQYSDAEYFNGARYGECTSLGLRTAGGFPEPGPRSNGPGHRKCRVSSAGFRRTGQQQHELAEHGFQPRFGVKASRLWYASYGPGNRSTHPDGRAGEYFDG